MKSVMEEASSIFKAIENAWKRAGQPHDFSVKVFEEPQRNFFGLTVKSAKIGLFFDEKSLPKVAAVKTAQPVAPKQKAEPQKTHSEKLVSQKKVAQSQKSKEPAPAKKASMPAKSTQQEKIQPSVFVKTSNSAKATMDRSTDTVAKASLDRSADMAESSESIWTPEMVKAAEEWTRTTLSLMNMPHITFSTKLSKYYIHFSFDSKLFENNMKEKTVFRSFAYLIMASLRNTFKKEFRGLKVVLSS